jgi:peptide/histidine transporter 3/4
MLPLVFSATVAHVSSSLLIAFTVQQGATTNTKLGKVHVYPAMLFIIPSIFQTLMLVAYDRLLVPLLRRRTGYTGGITQLQRVAVGFLAASVAPAVAAVVERKRKDTVAAAGGHISLFWLAPQFFLIGVEDTTAFAGLLEFFTAEAPDGMKSIGVAFFWCQAGMASLLGTLLVRLVNRVTHSSSAPGWLEGKDLNSSHLDLFYWVVTAVSFLGWLNYLYWANRYKYRHDPRISTKSPDEEDSMP